MLSFWLLLELLLTGLLAALWNGREMVWFPGLFLLVVGKLSGERIGLGDGWLLLALGMWLPYGMLMEILFLGLLAGAGYGILTGKKEIPLVPFFTVGFVLTVGGDDYMKRQWNRKKGTVCAGSVHAGSDNLHSSGLSGLFYALPHMDCAVVTHGILESGVKGIYRDGKIRRGNQRTDAGRSEQKAK